MAIKFWRLSLKSVGITCPFYRYFNEMKGFTSSDTTFLPMTCFGASSGTASLPPEIEQEFLMKPTFINGIARRLPCVNHSFPATIHWKEFVKWDKDVIVGISKRPEISLKQKGFWRKTHPIKQQKCSKANLRENSQYMRKVLMTLTSRGLYRVRMQNNRKQRICIGSPLSFSACWRKNSAILSPSASSLSSCLCSVFEASAEILDLQGPRSFKLCRTLRSIFCQMDKVHKAFRLSKVILGLHPPSVTVLSMKIHAFCESNLAI